MDSDIVYKCCDCDWWVPDDTQNKGGTGNCESGCRVGVASDPRLGSDYACKIGVAYIKLAIKYAQNQESISKRDVFLAAMLLGASSRETASQVEYDLARYISMADAAAKGDNCG